jgi:hypothetical protein
VCWFKRGCNDNRRKTTGPYLLAGLLCGRILPWGKSMAKPIMTIPGVEKRCYRNLSGRCYEIAFQFVSDNQDWTLIHGTLDIADALGRNDEKYHHYKHAWAEKGDHVYDPSHNYYYLKKEFETDFHAKATKRYSFDEACHALGNAGKTHYGPWHE